MASVVFLRGVNVGAARRVSTVEVARKLDAVNVGAAGTFVVRRAVAATRLEAEVRSALGFDTEIMVRPARMIQALAERAGSVDVPRGARLFLTVLSCAPERTPALPLDRPATGAWVVRVLERERSLVLSVRKPGARFYPNEVVEKAFGVPATTRDWTTVKKVLARLSP